MKGIVFKQFELCNARYYSIITDIVSDVVTEAVDYKQPNVKFS